MLLDYRFYGPPQRCPAWAVELTMLTAIISGVLSIWVELLLSIAICVVTEFIRGGADARWSLQCQVKHYKALSI